MGYLNLNDVEQKEIVEFLGELLVGNTSPTVSVEAHKQFRLADEYESISDYIRTLSKLLKKMHSSEFPIHANDESNLHQLHADVNLYLQGINRWLMDGGQDRLPEAVSGSERINSLFKQARREHLDRIQKNSVKPLSSLVFVDILQSYRKVKGHTLNIAEALSGEK